MSLSVPSSLCSPVHNPARLSMEDSSRGLSDPGWSHGTGLSEWEGSAALDPGLLCSSCCPVGQGGQRRETEHQSLLTTEPCQAWHLLTTPLPGPALPGPLHTRPGRVSAGLGWAHSDLSVPPRASPEAEVCCCGTDVVRGQEEHMHSGLRPDQTGEVAAREPVQGPMTGGRPQPPPSSLVLTRLAHLSFLRWRVEGVAWPAHLGKAAQEGKQDRALSPRSREGHPVLWGQPGLEPQNLPPSHCGALSQLLWAPQHLPLPSTFLTSQSLGLVFCGLVFWKRQACGLGLPPSPAVQRVQPVPPIGHLAP